MQARIVGAYEFNMERLCLEYTCPVCGKVFACRFPDDWVFKRNKKFLCSYGCTRKYDQTHKRRRRLV